MHRSILLYSLLAVACLACGRDTGEQPDPGSGAGKDPRLTLVPAEGHTRASGAPLLFQAVRENTEDAVSWSLQGPGTIAERSSTEVVYTPPADGDTQLTATLTATAGSLQASATIVVDPLTGVTVTGKLVLPGMASAANRPVWILGTTPTRTDEAGNFTVRGVITPYDLAVVLAEPGEPATAFVFRGITRLDPIVGTDLAILGEGLIPQVQGRVLGKITGGADPLPELSRTDVVFEGEGAAAAEAFADLDGSYLLNVGWQQGASVTGTLHALQWQRGEKFHTGYTGYGSKPEVTVAAGQDVEGQDIELEPVEQAQFAGRVTTPGLTTFLVTRTFDLMLGNSSIALGMEMLDITDFSLSSLIPAEFSFPTPRIAGATMRVSALAVGLTKMPDAEFSLADISLSVLSQPGLAIDAANVNIAIPAAPLQSAPADEATGVDASTVFSWDGQGGLSIVALSAPEAMPIPGLPGGEDEYGSLPFVAVVTAEASTTLPDLWPLGFELPRASRYGWRVANLPHVTSVDELVGPEGAQPASGAIRIGVSAERQFLTAE